MPLSQAGIELRRILLQSMHLNRLRQMPAYWLSRAIVALEILVSIVGVSWFEAHALTARAINQSGKPGWALVGVLFMFCLIALCDVVINDLLPDSFSFRYGLEHRHIGFLGMALTLALIATLVTYQSGFTFLLLVYWLNAALAALIAYMDIFTRLRR